MKSALHYFFLLPFCSQPPPQPPHPTPPPRQKTQTNNKSQAKTKQMIQKIMLNWIRQSGCTEHEVQHPKNIIKLITCTITIMVLNVLQRKLSVPKNVVELLYTCQVLIICLEFKFLQHPCRHSISFLTQK